MKKIKTLNPDGVKHDGESHGVFLLFLAAKLSLAIVGVFLFLGGVAYAEKEINIPALADAIYLAEGGANTRHPYGILAKYKTTTPRQACINTIKHALRDWDGKGDFITFLGSRYCPIGASNDPTGLNKNWVKNVTYFYKRGNHEM